MVDTPPPSFPLQWVEVCKRKFILEDILFRLKIESCLRFCEKYRFHVNSLYILPSILELKKILLKHSEDYSPNFQSFLRIFVTASVIFIILHIQYFFLNHSASSFAYIRKCTSLRLFCCCFTSHIMGKLSAYILKYFHLCSNTDCERLWLLNYLDIYWEISTTNKVSIYYTLLDKKNL